MTTTDTTDPTDTGEPGAPDAEPGGEPAATTADGALDLSFEDELDVFDDVVDPRLRARWVEARRAEGRRRLYVICGVVGTLAVGVIAYVIAHSSLLGAGTVTVEGATRTTPAAIRTAAHIADGDPLLFLDEGAIAGRVEALPMVARASVSTELPSTVVIHVTERVPVAWVRTPVAPHLAVLDRDGRVLDRVETTPSGLAQVAGVGTVGAPGSRVSHPRLLRAFAALPPELRIQTARFLGRPTTAVLVLAGDAPAAAEIHFGSLDRMRTKTAAALAVLQALQAQGRTARVIDVQVPEKPVTR